MNLYFSYFIIIAGVLLTALLFTNRNLKKQTKFMGFITVFGGAFLLAVCFMNLAPHVYDNLHIHAHEGCSHETSCFPLKIGVFVLVGFLIQLLLETFTQGAEHGHFHGEASTERQHAHNHHHYAVLPLLIGVCIHAFLEGMPIAHEGNQVQVGLVWGIFIHNIPIALILLTLFKKSGYSTFKTFSLLALFAIMTPLGSIVKNTFLNHLENFETVITAVVIGILLHVAVSILFFEEHTQKNKLEKFIVILSAFVLVYFLPSCAH